jgi:hypothetical protein
MRRFYISIFALFVLAAPASFVFAATGTIVASNQMRGTTTAAM